MFYYPNVNRNALLYRSYDMSAVVGGAYRGIVNNKLYNGTEQSPMEYEYGYIYGGLFVLGYCNFIHTYAREHGIDKLLFLSRDGDIFKTGICCAVSGGENRVCLLVESCGNKTDGAL